MKKDIFLVDADGTLLDFEASSLAALKAAFRHFSIEWQEEFADRYFRFNDSLWEKLERKELTRERLHATRFPLFLELLGFTHISGEEFNEIYLQNLSTLPVYFEGAEAFLEKLNQAGRVYIVTNGTAWIQASRFSICGLPKYVKDVFVSEDAGADKPDPKYTAYVEARIPDFDGERAVWIGDSLSADIKAANDRGITAVWYNPKKKPQKAGIHVDFSAENFAEILDFLQIS